MSRIAVAIFGAAGRMGQRLVHAVHNDADLRVAAAIESSNHASRGQDIGEASGLGPIGITISDRLEDRVDCVVDFSMPEASVAIAQLCSERQIPLLVATTGHTSAQRQEILAAHHQTPLLIAANLSLVVNVMMKLVKDASRILHGKDFDVEIVERHHRFKKDAPSGTALKFAEIIEEQMQITERSYGREGITGERPRNQIGLHAVRSGDNVGEHNISFSTIGETLEIVHKGHSRDSYIKGAILAIKYLANRPAGLYTMADVLGID